MSPPPKRKKEKSAIRFGRQKQPTPSAAGRRRPIGPQTISTSGPKAQPKPLLAYRRHQPHSSLSLYFTSPSSLFHLRSSLFPSSTSHLGILPLLFYFLSAFCSSLRARLTIPFSSFLPRSTLRRHRLRLVPGARCKCGTCD